MILKRSICLLFAVSTFNICYSQSSTSTFIGGACTFSSFQGSNVNHYSIHKNIRSIPYFGIKVKESIGLVPKLSGRIGVEFIGTKTSFLNSAGTGFNAATSQYDDQNYLHKLNIFEIHIPLEIMYELLNFQTFKSYGGLGIGYRSYLFSNGSLNSINNENLYSDRLKIVKTKFINSNDLWTHVTPKFFLGFEMPHINDRLSFFCEFEYTYLFGYYQYSGSKNSIWFNDEGIFNNHVLDITIGVKISNDKK